jgi:hypothetical protein
MDANFQRSILDQVVVRCQTEAPQKRMPLDDHTGRPLLAKPPASYVRHQAPAAVTDNSIEATRNIDFQKQIPY